MSGDGDDKLAERMGALEARVEWIEKHTDRAHEEAVSIREDMKALTEELRNTTEEMRVAYTRVNSVGKGVVWVGVFAAGLASAVANIIPMMKEFFR